MSDGVLRRLRGCIAGDQAGTAAEGQVFESPLNKNDDAALKLHDINQVDEKPHQPGQQTGNVDAKNVCDRGGAADHGHFALIEIMKWRKLFPSVQTGADDLGHVRTALHRDLRDSGKDRSLLIYSVS